MFLIVAFIAALGAGVVGVRAVTGHHEQVAQQQAPAEAPAPATPPPDQGTPAPEQ